MGIQEDSLALIEGKIRGRRRRKLLEDLINILQGEIETITDYLFQGLINSQAGKIAFTNGFDDLIYIIEKYIVKKITSHQWRIIDKIAISLIPRSETIEYMGFTIEDIIDHSKLTSGQKRTFKKRLGIHK